MKKTNENTPLIGDDSKDRFRRLIFEHKKKGKGYFNIVTKNLSFKKKYSNPFHYILDLSWWKVFLLMTILYLLIHFFFGFLYFIGGLFDLSSITKIHESLFMIYLYCFFFSVDIMTTNGTFGIIIPTSLYERLIVTFESYFSYFFETLLIAFILGKFARPSKLKKNMLFSSTALIYQKGIDWFFSFRYSNLRTRKSPPMSVTMNLLLLVWKNEKEFEIHELDYNCYKQTKKSENVGFSNPILPIPHEITHHITKDSPFFNFLSKIQSDGNNLSKLKFEFIIFIEGIDSATSENYQAYKSYTQDDLNFQKVFKNCIIFKDDKFVIDYNLFNEFEHNKIINV